MIDGSGTAMARAEEIVATHCDPDGGIRKAALIASIAAALASPPSSVAMGAAADVTAKIDPCDLYTLTAFAMACGDDDAENAAIRVRIALDGGIQHLVASAKPLAEIDAQLASPAPLPDAAQPELNDARLRTRRWPLPPSPSHHRACPSCFGLTPCMATACLHPDAVTRSSDVPAPFSAVPASVAPTSRQHIRRQCLCGHADSSHGLADGRPACRFCRCSGFRWEAGEPVIVPSSVAAHCVACEQGNHQLCLGGQCACIHSAALASPPSSIARGAGADVMLWCSDCRVRVPDEHAARNHERQGCIVRTYHLAALAPLPDAPLNTAQIHAWLGRWIDHLPATAVLELQWLAPLPDAAPVGWREMPAEVDRTVAPFNGKPVLIYDASWCGGPPRITASYWIAYQHRPGRLAGWEEKGSFSGVTKPTHWQPLPPDPPSSSPAAKEKP